jgi:hypothetical protein
MSTPSIGSEVNNGGASQEKTTSIKIMKKGMPTTKNGHEGGAETSLGS